MYKEKRPQEQEAEGEEKLVYPATSVLLHDSNQFVVGEDGVDMITVNMEDAVDGIISGTIFFDDGNITAFSHRGKFYIEWDVHDEEEGEGGEGDKI